MSININNYFIFRNLKLISETIMIICTEKEYISNTNLYARGTTANCKCLNQKDCHNFLLWNVGGGVFISYYLLSR